MKNYFLDFGKSSQNYFFITVQIYKGVTGRKHLIYLLAYDLLKMNLTKSVYVIPIEFLNEFHKYIFGENNFEETNESKPFTLIFNKIFYVAFEVLLS